MTTETVQRELDAAQARYDTCDKAANALRDAIMAEYYSTHDLDDDDFDDAAEQVAYDAATEKADELFDAMMDQFDALMDEFDR